MNCNFIFSKDINNISNTFQYTPIISPIPSIYSPIQTIVPLSGYYDYFSLDSNASTFSLQTNNDTNNNNDNDNINKLSFISQVQNSLIEKLDKFFNLITDYLLKEEKLSFYIIDLEKSSKFNYDEGRYTLPEDPKNFTYVEYSLSTHSRKIAQILKISSIIYQKTLTFASSTKRELYYNDVELFKSTENIDSIINDLCSILLIHRFDLPIFPSAKGLFSGRIKIYTDKGQQLNISSSSSLNKINLITYEYITNNFTIEPNCIPEFILIVEKETIFFNLIENNEFISNFSNILIITGKGYPDYTTKVFINKISKLLPQIPIYYFGDNDPHGFEIFLNYLFGSKRSARENEFMSLNNIQWIGLNYEMIRTITQNGEISEQQGFIKLSSKDIKKIEIMKNREYFKLDYWSFSLNPYKEIIVANLEMIYNELMIIENRGFKAEGEFIISKYICVFVDWIKGVLYKTI